jgi:hypothetical protein
LPDRQAHNLKVIGSNPIPATKLRRQVKGLAALPFWRLWFNPAPGSTVEARARVIVGTSEGWRVGRVVIPQRLVTDCNPTPNWSCQPDEHIFMMTLDRLAMGSGRKGTKAT